MIKVVPATYDMVRSFYGHGLAHSMRALAAVRGEEVLGVVGVYPEHGRQVIFMDVKDELRSHPMAFARGSKVVMRWLRESRMPTHAMCDETIEAAERFLERLGFRRIHKQLFEWQPPQYR